MYVRTHTLSLSVSLSLSLSLTHTHTYTYDYTVLEQARQLDPLMSEQLISAHLTRHASDCNVVGREDMGVGVEVLSSTGEKTGTFLRN